MYIKYILTCQANCAVAKRSFLRTGLFLALGRIAMPERDSDRPCSGTESEAVETGDLTTAEQPCRIGQTSAVAIRFGQWIESEFAS
jgi:hypothetical protein